jgi:cytochrome c-type biogenesis protein CcmE
MKKSLFLSLLIVSAVAFAAQTEKIADIVANQAKYDGKEVSVTGKVSNYKSKTSKSGRDYTTLDVVDAGKTVAVYAQGKLSPEPKDGDKVEVTGKYAKEKKIGGEKGFTVKNQIDASGKKDKPANIKIVK